MESSSKSSKTGDGGSGEGLGRDRARAFKVFRWNVSPNSVFNTWGSYGNSKRPGA